MIYFKNIKKILPFLLKVGMVKKVEFFIEKDGKFFLQRYKKYQGIFFKNFKNIFYNKNKIELMELCLNSYQTVRQLLLKFKLI